MVVDAVVMEGCNDARFTIERPESEAELLDTTYLTLTARRLKAWTTTNTSPKWSCLRTPPPAPLSWA